MTLACCVTKNTDLPIRDFEEKKNFFFYEGVHVFAIIEQVWKPLLLGKQ